MSTTSVDTHREDVIDEFMFEIDFLRERQMHGDGVFDDGRQRL